MKLISRFFKILGSVIAGCFMVAVAIGVTLWGSIVFAAITTLAGVLAVVGFVSFVVYEILFGKE
jgi:hypothetical protein|tara:strand:- start:2 stop:193 length:192 start_codon:yes stop_codon:yes gene_type:complete